MEEKIYFYYRRNHTRLGLGLWVNNILVVYLGLPPAPRAQVEHRPNMSSAGGLLGCHSPLLEAPGHSWPSHVASTVCTQSGLVAECAASCPPPHDPSWNCCRPRSRWAPAQAWCCSPSQTWSPLSLHEPLARTRAEVPEMIWIKDNGVETAQMMAIKQLIFQTEIFREAIL